MREFWLYVVPALLTYPLAIAAGRRMRRTTTYWAVTIGALVSMVVAVGIASLGGDTAWVAIPVGMAFGVVLGVRHGYRVIPAMREALGGQPADAEPAEAETEAERAG